MVGRSNLQQAVPITFGYKVAAWLSTIKHHQQRLAELRPRVLVGELGGAAGTLASLGNAGLKVQEELMAELGLGQPEIAWHTARDRIAEVGCFPGTGDRDAGQDHDRREATHANGGRRGLRTLRQRSWFKQHHAAEAQSDLLQLYSRLYGHGAPTGSGPSGRYGRGSRALHWPLGN